MGKGAQEELLGRASEKTGWGPDGAIQFQEREKLPDSESHFGGGGGSYSAERRGPVVARERKVMTATHRGRRVAAGKSEAEVQSESFSGICQERKRVKQR